MAENSKLDALMKEIHDFKTSAEAALTEIRDDVKAVKTKVGELETGISELRKEVAIVRGEQDVQRLDIDTLKVWMKEACSRIEYLEGQVEMAERYSRRENVMLYGIHEPHNEPPSSCKKKVVDLLNKDVPQLDRQWSPRDIVRAHRVGPRRPNTTRPMIVKFLHSDDKFEVLGARERFKQLCIGVGNDLTAFQRQQVKKARQEGKRGYFKGGEFKFDDVPAPRHHSASPSRQSASSPRQPASPSRQPASSPRQPASSSRQPASPSSQSTSPSRQSTSSSSQSAPSSPGKSSAPPSASSPRRSYAEVANAERQRAEEQSGSSEASRPTTRSQSQSRQRDDASSTPASQSA